MVSYRWPLTAAGIAICISACSKFVPVEGVVTLDGKPLAGASVSFHPQEVTAGERGGAKQAAASTDQNGRFRLKTVKNEGAWPGTYKVTVSKRAIPPDAEVPGRNFVPHKEDMDELAEVDEQVKMPDITKFPGLISAQNVNLGDFMKETLPELYIKESTTPLTLEIPDGGTKEANLELKSEP